MMYIYVKSINYFNIKQYHTKFINILAQTILKQTRGSNFSVLRFQLIFKNYKCFPFREYKLSIYSNKL